MRLATARGAIALWLSPSRHGMTALHVGWVYCVVGEWVAVGAHGGVIVLGTWAWDICAIIIFIDWILLTFICNFVGERIMIINLDYGYIR